ncbi:MAG: hypothetical protein ACRDRN_19155 [Sciscionella sp.]
MDPRDRADAMLARARARRGYIVTPEDAVSPMDAANTLQIPRSVVAAADHPPDVERTTSIPAPAPRGEVPQAPAATEPPSTEVTQPLPTQEPAGRPVDGMVPTVQEAQAGRRTLSQRLGGE